MDDFSSFSHSQETVQHPSTGSHGNGEGEGSQDEQQQQQQQLLQEQLQRQHQTTTPMPLTVADGTFEAAATTASAEEDEQQATTTTTTTTPTHPQNKKRRVSSSYGSRTTIMEIGLKRRSCICTNSKECNELMTKWAKCTPSMYHYVQLPRFAGMDENLNTIRNISDTELYKNQFRMSTLRYLSVKNPIPKDERIALLHYPPQVREYLYWPKNTPAHSKYAIPSTLAATLDNYPMDVERDRCQGLNHQDYCYVVPCYNFETAKQEILEYESQFYEKVREIKQNPQKFVREYQALQQQVEALQKQVDEHKQEHDTWRQQQHHETLLKERMIPQEQAALIAAAAGQHAQNATASASAAPTTNNNNTPQVVPRWLGAPTTANTTNPISATTNLPSPAYQTPILQQQQQQQHHTTEQQQQFYNNNNNLPAPVTNATFTTMNQQQHHHQQQQQYMAPNLNNHTDNPQEQQHQPHQHPNVQHDMLANNNTTNAPTATAFALSLTQLSTPAATAHNNHHPHGLLHTTTLDRQLHHHHHDQRRVDEQQQQQHHHHHQEPIDAEAETTFPRPHKWPPKVFKTSDNVP